MTTATVTATDSLRALEARRQELSRQLERKRAEAGRIRETAARNIAEGSDAQQEAAFAVHLAAEIDGISDAIALLDTKIAEAERAEAERRRAEAVQAAAASFEAARAALSEQEAWLGQLEADLTSRLECLTEAMLEAGQAANRAHDSGAQLPRALE